MAKEKIVRCIVSQIRSGGREESVRYVPLEVFSLWKHLMTEKHGFEIGEQCVSLWFDIDGDPNVNYSDSNYDKVMRIYLSLYSEEDGMFHKITRYFPSAAYDHIRPRFLSHYSRYFAQAKFPARLEETHGVWLKRED